MLKRVNGFTGKVGSVGFNASKSFPINPITPIEPIQTQIRKPYPEKEKKSKFQKK